MTNIGAITNYVCLLTDPSLNLDSSKLSEAYDKLILELQKVDYSIYILGNRINLNGHLNLTELANIILDRYYEGIGDVIIEYTYDKLITEAKRCLNRDLEWD